jgi:hypothetical protein
VSRAFLTARWRDLVLVTYPIPDDLALPLVPAGCEPDRWAGRCHVSLVALQMERVRFRGIAVPGLTAYPQVNLRLYVRHEGRAAVRFIQELVPSRLLAAGARWLYGEPFRVGRIEARLGTGAADYRFGIEAPGSRVAVRGGEPELVPQQASFEHWIQERLRGCRTDRTGRLRTFDVAHPPWRIRTITQSEVRVGFAELYGARWAPLDGLTPVSVVYAVGSEVTVSAPS